MSSIPARRTVLLPLGQDKPGWSWYPLRRAVAPTAANRLWRRRWCRLRPWNPNTWWSVPVGDLRRGWGFTRGLPRPLLSRIGRGVWEGRKRGCRYIPSPHPCDRPSDQSRHCSSHSHGQASYCNSGFSGNVGRSHSTLPPAQKLLLVENSPLLASCGILVAGVVRKDSVPAGRAEWKVLKDFHPQAVPMPTPATT